MNRPYKMIPVYFSTADEDQMKLYNKLRELEFKNVIPNKGGYLRELAFKATKKM